MNDGVPRANVMDEYALFGGEFHRRVVDNKRVKLGLELNGLKNQFRLPAVVQLQIELGEKLWRWEKRNRFTVQPQTAGFKCGEARIIRLITAPKEHQSNKDQPYPKHLIEPSP